MQKKTSSFRYAIGMFGTSIPINMFKTYASAYYVMTRGATFEQMGVVLMVYAILDAIDNPVYGFLSDHTRTKWGRRRPWLVIGTPLLILFFILFFSAPASLEAGSTSLFVYMLLMYLLTGTLDSLINANYGALFPELFKDDKKRTSTNAMRQAFQLVAMAISIALTPMVTERLGYQNTAIVYGVLALVVILFCATGCHENPENLELEKPKLFRTIIDLFKNPKFWIFGLTNAFYAAAFSLIMQAIPFFATYTLKVGSTQQTILMGSVLGVALVGVGIWSFIVKKLPLIKAWRLALLLMAVGFIPLYFADTFGTVIGFATIIAFGAAGSISTMDVIGARIMDDDFNRHGIRREGIIASALGVLNRLNGLYTGLVMIIMEKAFGFISGDNPGSMPDVASRFMFVVFPFIAMVLSFAVSHFLRFKNGEGNES